MNQRLSISIAAVVFELGRCWAERDGGRWTAAFSLVTWRSIQFKSGAIHCSCFDRRQLGRSDADGQEIGAGTEEWNGGRTDKSQLGRWLESPVRKTHFVSVSSGSRLYVIAA